MNKNIWITYIVKTYYFPDLEPPSISCPNEMMQETVSEEMYAIIDRPAIEVGDNSGSTPTLICNNTFPEKFLLGTTFIECVATDATNNTAQCLFKVNIVGKFLHFFSIVTIRIA